MYVIASYLLDIWKLMTRFVFKFQLYNIVYSNITNNVLRFRGQLPNIIVLTKPVTSNQLDQDECSINLIFEKLFTSVFYKNGNFKFLKKIIVYCITGNFCGVKFLRFWTKKKTFKFCGFCFLRIEKNCLCYRKQQLKRWRTVS